MLLEAEALGRRFGVRAAVVALLAAGCLLESPIAVAGPYVTETSGVRWSDASGVRWSDASGVRWSDASGLRWNDAGGVRWSDAASVFLCDASGVRWSDAAGVRWNDAAELEFLDATVSLAPSIDIELLDTLSVLPDSSAVNVIVTYRSMPTSLDISNMKAIGIPGGTLFRQLPMVVVNATRNQIKVISKFPSVRSVYSNRALSLFDDSTRALTGLDEVVGDPELALPGGGPPTGAGVTIATLDTGVDATHPDLPLGTKVVQNVRLNGAIGTGPGFVYLEHVEGVPNTDLVLGHGTFVASVAAGTGAASGGLYRGVAPGASILSLSTGDVFLMNVLEGFDYILENDLRFGVRVVNCSWGTTGWFDPDDPVNIATRALYNRGITVVFAAGNHGPAPDTLNPYAVAPWVIGVGSTRTNGRLSAFSSRGLFDELLTHPVLVAPGEGIIAASPAHLGGVNGVVGVADPPSGVTVPPEHAAYYSVSSGTSFSAPHVAGIVALMLETRPDLTPGEIKQILQKTASPMLTHDRAEVGAGRVDAWAALTQLHDASRPFGTHFEGWLDGRSYATDHLEAKASSGYVPSAGSLTIPITLPRGTVSWQMTMSWPTVSGGNDLDVRLRDTSGAEIARSEAISGTALFGCVEGLHLWGAPPEEMMLDVFFKGGTSVLGQQITMLQETSIARATGFTDLEGLPASARDAIDLALARHVMAGRQDTFQPYAALTRGEAARALALAAGLPQRVTSGPTFDDEPATALEYPYVESVAGARAWRRLLNPVAQGSFQPDSPIRRLEFTLAVVRAAGLDAEAEARAGEAVPVLDIDAIAFGHRGYVGIAIERGLIGTQSVVDGAVFDPEGSLTRLEASTRFLRLLDVLIRDGGPAVAAPDTDPLLGPSRQRGGLTPSRTAFPRSRCGGGSHSCGKDQGSRRRSGRPTPRDAGQRGVRVIR